MSGVCVSQKLSGSPDSHTVQYVHHPTRFDNRPLAQGALRERGRVGSIVSTTTNHSTLSLDTCVDTSAAGPCHGASCQLETSMLLSVPKSTAQNSSLGPSLIRICIVWQWCGEKAKIWGLACLYVYVHESSIDHKIARILGRIPRPLPTPSTNRAIINTISPMNRARSPCD